MFRSDIMLEDKINFLSHICKDDQDPIFLT